MVVPSTFLTKCHSVLDASRNNEIRHLSLRLHKLQHRKPEFKGIVSRGLYLFKVGLHKSKPLFDAAFNVAATLTDISHN